MIKVLLIGQLPKEAGGNYTTGIAKVVYELSKQIVDGVEYHVYATNAKNSRITINSIRNHYYGYRFLVSKLLYNIISHPVRTLHEWKVYRESAHVNPLRYEFYKVNFEKVLAKVQPDVIHMNGCGIEPLYFANKKYGTPIVLTCHGVFTRFKNPNSSAKLYADYVTGLTEETREEIQNYLCIEMEPVIIPNGVDTKTFYYSAEERALIRHEMDVKPSTIVFVTVASISQRKGQLSFIKILEQTDLDYEYWIIGQGEDEQNIRQYIADKPFSSRIKLLGYKNGDQLFKYYSAADIYAHASTMEGQALCEIEAFSTGIRTVVNSKIKGTIAEQELKNGDYLFMDFEHPNIPAFCEWSKIVNVNRHTRDNLDWSSVSSQYKELYFRILEK